MAQHDYGNPQSPFSGAQLNATLRNWRDALHTLHRGASRPTYAQGGMLWVREVSGTQWELKLYDGVDDILVATINPVANTVAPAGAVMRTGDTMTGDLVINKSAAVLRLNSSTATTRGLRFSTNNLERWAFLVMNDAESGGNTGSTLRLRRFDDSGTFIGDVFSVDRATGRLSFSGGVLPRVQSIDPTDNNDVVRKAYVDALVNARVAKAGDTMTGPLTLPGAPTATNHAATKGYVDSAIAAALTTGQVLAATAGAAVGAIGTYVLAWCSTDSGLNPGDTVAGSDLRYANDGGNGGEAGRSTTALSGTWRLMGSLGWRLGTSGYTGNNTPHKTSLWLRIA